MNYIPGKNLWRMALAAGCLLAGSGLEARANSYASSLTNNLGEVSFRLNDAADSVKIVGNAGALTIDLGPLPRGLTVTNLATQGLLPGAFSVRVVQVGSGAPSLIGASIPFNSPRGVTVNSNPKSPNFGWVYVANSAAGAKGDGLFAYTSDLTDILNQGATPRTGGITNFTVGTGSSPYRLKVGREDNNIYVADWSDGSGNLYVVDPNLSDSPDTSYVLKAGVKTRGENPPATNPATAPVGPDNNHGSVAAVEVLGTLADGNLQVFTIDEDYQTDPSATGLSEVNSLWRYDVGAGPLPYNDPPAARIGTAPISFVSQTMDLSYSPGSGYFYYSDLRSNGTEPGVIAVDKDGNVLFNSKLASSDLGSGVDYLIALQGVAASPDGKWLATMGNNNVVTIVPMVDGIPNLAQRFQYTGFATTLSGRGIAFDVANNLYVVSSGVGLMQSLSLGFTATNVTSSDGTFTQTTPSTEVSGTLIVSDSPATEVTLAEATAAESAIFRITRAKDDFAGPLSVNITATGATRGTDTTGDYSIRTNGVVTAASAIVIPAGEASIDLQIVVNDDNISELAEVITITVGGGAYNAVSPLSGKITIVDNDATSVDISAVSFNTAYEGNTNDFLRYTVQRRGDTTAADFTVNIAYAGTATPGVDYTPVASLTIPSGAVTNFFDVPVLNDAALEGTETVIASIAAGSGYAIGTNNVLTAAATGTIVDDEEPAETVLFSDNFNTDSSADWNVLFGSVNPESLDYQASFGLDYSTFGVPAAPHSADGNTTGLVLTVNKGGLTQAAGLSVYPKDKSFSGNYAVRFDMYLMQNNAAGTTEYATYGINHSGTKTNWFRNSGAGAPVGSEYDGLWYFVVADASNLGANGTASDYGLLSSPTLVGLNSPTVLATRLASQFAQTFHSPPWTSGGGAGSPGNTSGTATPSWSQVEISQIGNIVQMRINSTVILTYTNKTAYTSGDLMLGYTDAYDSVGSGGGGLVIYDNVRVVKLPDAITITNIVQIPGNKLQFDFTGFVNEPASSFKLVTSGTNIANAFVTDANAQTTYSVVTPGTTYRATTPTTNTAGFYEIRRP
jgi:hypothetical protein